MKNLYVIYYILIYYNRIKEVINNFEDENYGSILRLYLSLYYS